MTDPPTPPVGRQRLSPDQRRWQLLTAAETVFAEQGYGSTSFDDIAERAGVTRPLLYRYFRSTEEMYLACHRAAREELQQRLSDATAGTPKDAQLQLRTGLAAYFRFVAERPARFRLLYGPGTAGGPLAEQTAEMRFGTADQIAEIFVATGPRVRRADAVAHAHIVSGGAEQLAKWWQHHPETSLDAVVELAMTVVWSGLNALTAPRPGGLDNTSARG
jgi:AcrR family transcriptional regulator